MHSFQPAYLQTAERGLLQTKIAQSKLMLAPCHLCPRDCGSERTKGRQGVCETGDNAIVYSHSAHFGEEKPLVGRHGSGTIFFTNCNLRCLFCQNYDISLQGNGREVTASELAAIMLDLQGMGCHNINFVTPSHVVSQILAALDIAVHDGLRIPLVYNSSAYDSVETLKLLDGIIDIYMPDFKFWDPHVAKLLSKAEDYPEVAQAAILEMHRQLGDLQIDRHGIARHGLLLRHLVLPDDYAGTRQIMRFIANKISVNTYVNIMKQYHPYGQARNMNHMNRPVSHDEYNSALAAAREEGILRFDDKNDRIRFRIY
jgi:putative pyruvate formate lyase activating enzyme